MEAELVSELDKYILEERCYVEASLNRLLPKSLLDIRRGEKHRPLRQQHRRFKAAKKLLLKVDGHSLRRRVLFIRLA